MSMCLLRKWDCHISLQSESFSLDPDNVEEPWRKQVRDRHMLAIVYDQLLNFKQYCSLISERRFC